MMKPNEKKTEKPEEVKKPPEHSGTELNDDDLENVAGGGEFWNCFEPGR